MSRKYTIYDKYDDISENIIYNLKKQVVITKPNDNFN